MAAATEHDAAYLALRRQLYWALEAGSDEVVGARQVREQLMAFAWRMRVDEGLSVPMGEPHLTSHLKWRRRWKYLVFRSARFAFRRYDRLLAEVADLAVAVSERVVELEVETEHLREELARLEGRSPPR